MTISLADFLSQITVNPMLAVTVILTLGVILVNGWTDALNAIATCVSTQAIHPKFAIIMAAVFNFLGVLVMTIFNAGVASTIYNMVDFGGDPHESLIALCAALLLLWFWATVAWWFGIPTSESHALIAGVSGATIALHGGMDGINASEWIKVIYGLLLSTVLGFVMGWLTAKTVQYLCRGMDRGKTRGVLIKHRLPGRGHGLHARSPGQPEIYGSFHAGNFSGKGKCGRRRVQYSGLADDTLLRRNGTGNFDWRIPDHQGSGNGYGEAGTLPGLFCRSGRRRMPAFVFSDGIPVSTTHTKTTAIMGVGAARRVSSVNWGVVKEMVLTWVLTFPGAV